MDEVKTMAQAGEHVGRAVGTGIRTARQGAALAGKASAAASRQAATRAEHELAQRGISTDELQERLAQRATGMSRRTLAKKRRKARKQLSRNTRAARKELAARIDPTIRKGRRKWPWFLFVLAGLGIAAAVVLSRRPEEMPVAEAESSGADPAQSDGQPSSDGAP
jgi:hypothetical protein